MAYSSLRRPRPTGRISARALIVAAMLAAGALAAPAIAPAMAQKPAAPAGQGAVNKNMVKPLNEGIAAIGAMNWPEAKAKLDAAAAAAKTPQEKLIVEQQRFRMADGQKDAPGKIAAIKAALATGALSAEDAKPYKGSLAAALQESGDTAGATAAMKAFIDEYGGSAAQYGALATDARNAKDWPTAETYIQKAIDAGKAANMPAGEIEKYQAFQAHVYWDAKDDAKYTAAMAALIAANPGKEDYWKELMGRATQEPGYQAAGKGIAIDYYRTAMAIPLKLSTDDKAVAAQRSLDANLPAEAVAIYKPLFDSGEIGGASDSKAEGRKKSYAEAQSKAKKEADGMAGEEKDAAAKSDAVYQSQVGEVLMTHGEYARAAVLLKKAADTGLGDPGKTDIVKLHLGMAQLKAGDKAGAKATFASIKTENGSKGFARIWSIMADK